MNGRWIYFQTQQPKVRRFLASTERAKDVQREVLFRKLRLAADSDFGRDHGLAQIKSIDEFRRQLPVTDYEYYRPYVDRVLAGDTGAMFGGSTRLAMFALTSGTTDKQKLIPVTNHFVDEYKRGWKLWALQAHADHLDLLKKDYLHISSDWQKSQTSAGIWCGSISGLAAETRPAIVRRPFICPPQVARVDDWADRLYLTLRISLASRNVGMVITANPLTLISLAEQADRSKESLIRDLHDGTLDTDMRVPAGIRRKLARSLRHRHRERSRELEQIVDRTGQLLPRDFWPGLSVVGVWMGGAAGAFLPRVRELYGDAAFRDHGLSASEGRMTIPFDDESNAGLLEYDSTYFEFIPVEQYETENPQILEAHELSEDESYYILLTTSSGFFRYDIRDVVKCVGFQGTAPMLEFLHKGQNCANVTGEKLTESQVAIAVRDAFASLGRTTESVMIAPVITDSPGYVLMVEPHLGSDAELLSRKIDRRLAEINCEYEDRLQTCRLSSLRPVQVPEGTWDIIRDRKIASRGGSYEQYKHTFLGSTAEVFREFGAPISTSTGEMVDK